jgi:asparagine synthase (glutamine-hydrolysing)
MCGIAGFQQVAAQSIERLTALGREMADAIAHRGPDDQGVWVDEQTGVVLAHRRLAIVDLSPQGHQPMTSASGRYVLVLNGEIYNYDELRARLGARAWRGHSDTEVLLAAFDEWGIARSLALANGMFALAVVDRTARELVLARDRFGEKPLYYGWQGDAFLFGSELKSLRRHPGFAGELDLNSVAQYCQFGYVPAPRTIYAGISKLQPGECVTLRLAAQRAQLETTTFWTPPLPACVSESLDEHTAVAELDRILRRAVRLRMQADVPLGAFLSGGIDSSTIAALAQAQSSQPVRTFSIGFHESAHDESGHARAVADALGTQHTEMFVGPQDALAVVPELATLYDEPFDDSSQIPTHLLAKMTRRHVTVALSGDGGDELFGGYNRYFYGRRLASIRSVVPGAVRALGATMVQSLQAQRWDRLLSIAPSGAAVLFGGGRLTKLASALTADDTYSLYKDLVSRWKEPQRLLPRASERSTLIDDLDLRRRIACPIQWMMYMDLRTYLPDDILTKVDRATMACALEARVPFLDPDVAQFAAALPLHYKLRGNSGKWLLRRVLHRYLAPAFFRRPKQGFAVPLAQWLRGPLREWAEDLLSLQALRGTLAFEPGPIRASWAAHLSGRENHDQALWTILMYQMWHRQYRPLVH